MAKLLTGYQDMVGLLNVHKVARLNTQVIFMLHFNFFVNGIIILVYFLCAHVPVIHNVACIYNLLDLFIPLYVLFSLSLSLSVSLSLKHTHTICFQHYVHCFPGLFIYFIIDSDVLYLI